MPKSYRISVDNTIVVSIDYQGFMHLSEGLLTVQMPEKVRPAAYGKYGIGFDFMPSFVDCRYISADCTSKEAILSWEQNDGKTAPLSDLLLLTFEHDIFRGFTPSIPTWFVLFELAVYASRCKAISGFAEKVAAPGDVFGAIRSNCEKFYRPVDACRRLRWLGGTILGVFSAISEMMSALELAKIEENTIFLPPGSGADLDVNNIKVEIKKSHIGLEELRNFQGGDYNGIEDVVLRLLRDVKKVKGVFRKKADVYLCDVSSLPNALPLATCVERVRAEERSSRAHPDFSMTSSWRLAVKLAGEGGHPVILVNHARTFPSVTTSWTINLDEHIDAKNLSCL